MSWIREVGRLAAGESDELLTAAEAAELLRVAPRTVYTWGLEGVLPRVILAPHTIRYRMSDVRKFIEERTERR